MLSRAERARLLFLLAFGMLILGVVVATVFATRTPIPCQCPPPTNGENGTGSPCLCPAGYEWQANPVGFVLMAGGAVALVGGAVVGRWKRGPAP